MACWPPRPRRSPKTRRKRREQQLSRSVKTEFWVHKPAIPASQGTGSCGEESRAERADFHNSELLELVVKIAWPGQLDVHGKLSQADQRAHPIPARYKMVRGKVMGKAQLFERKQRIQNSTIVEAQIAMTTSDAWPSKNL